MATHTAGIILVYPPLINPMSKLIFILILFSYHFSLAQDPVRDIDPTLPTRRDNVERQSLPRNEIPGTLRDTQQDRAGFFDEEDSSSDPGSSGTVLPDTTAIRFVDENGKIIHDPNAYTRERVYHPEQRRKAADTLETFRHSEYELTDTTNSKP